MNRIRRWLLNSALFAGATLLAIALAEAGLRLISPQPTAITHQDRFGLIMHWPGIVRTHSAFGTTMRINSVGLRDREHTLEKPAGVFRILVLGDSFMEAVQVEFEQSLPGLLETGLAAATGKRIEVINGGVSGWGTEDELRYLTRYGLRYAPDLVLVAMTLHNDMSDNFRERWYTLRQDSLIDKDPPPLPIRQYRVLTAKAFLATHSHGYQLLRRVARRGSMTGVARALNQHIVELFTTPPSPAIERGYRLTEALLHSIDSAGRAHGARVAVALLPLQVQLSDTAFGEFLKAAGKSESSMPRTRPQDEIGTAAARSGIPVIDLLPPLRDWELAGRSPLYLRNDGHWSAEGHRLASTVVIEGLLRLGLAP